MFCRYCGQQIPEDGAFCPSCGKALHRAPKTEPVEEPSPIVAPTPVEEQSPIVAPTPVEEPSPIVAPTPVEEQFNDFAPSTQEIQESPQPKSRKAFQKVASILTKVAIPVNAVAFGFFVLAIFLTVVCFIETDNSYIEAVNMTNNVFYLATSLIAIGAEVSIAAFVFSRIQKEDENIKRRALGVFIGGLVLVTLISVSYGMFIGYFGGNATVDFFFGSEILPF